MMEGRLTAIWDGDCYRPCIGQPRGEAFPLHCGQVLEVETPAGWKQTRLELAGDTWVFAGIGPAEAGISVRLGG